MELDVIVGWDGSGPARAALDWAAHRQGSRPGTIRIVQVVDQDRVRAGSMAVGGSAGDGSALDEAVAGTYESLAVEADRVRLIARAARIDTEVLVGERQHELRQLSRAGSLLVVGIHAHGEHSSRYGWSLGAQLAPQAKGALAIVPEHVTGGRTDVVVGVDGSGGSMAAALVAAGEALLRGETLRAVHAWVEPIAGSGISGLNPEFVSWLKEANQELLDDSLRPVEKEFPGLRIERHLENDLPVRVMREHAKSASLVVVGTRGYGPVRRLLLGSVSHSLILSIECPIIVVGGAGSSDGDYPEHEAHTASS